MANVIAQLRAERYRTPIEERSRVYSSEPRENERRAEQLRLLNAEWERTTRVVPWFRRLRDTARLPGSFASLEEFAARVPVMSRATVQEHRDALCSEGTRPQWKRVTGGSTSQPVQIPAWNSELEATNPDIWVARGWYGVRPTSRLFLLWGHSHLLGTGVQGWINGRRRELSDRLLGYRRFSAYDLRPERLRAAADEMLRFRPDYLIGYSVALDLFARAAAPGYREALRRLGLRAVVGAAEAFPAPDSMERLWDLFNCPVAMEYGSVETNVMAHTHPEGGYRVFWRSYLIEVEGADPRGSVRVTSLYPRCVPLIRYEIGDEIELGDSGDPRLGVASFRRVLGRCNDYVLVEGGAPVHSEAITHAVRPCAAVQSYQLVQQGERRELHYTAERGLTREEECAMRARLARIHPALEHVPLQRVAELERTVAGKTPMILRRP